MESRKVAEWCWFVGIWDGFGGCEGGWQTIRILLKQNPINYGRVRYVCNLSILWILHNRNGKLVRSKHRYQLSFLFTITIYISFVCRTIFGLFEFFLSHFFCFLQLLFILYLLKICVRKVDINNKFYYLFFVQIRQLSIG